MKIIEYIKKITYSYRLKKAIKAYNKRSTGYQMDVVNGIVIKKLNRGENNKIVIGDNCTLYDVHFWMVGDDNIVEIGDNVIIGGGCRFVIQGDNIKIKIGDRCSISGGNIEFCAQEDNMYIELGEHCLLSHDICIRTSDAHPIYDLHSNARINYAKPVVVGKDVWIAPNTKIMKGANIGNGCIIGSDTMVNDTIPSNCLAVGHPATVVKENVYWTGEKLFRTIDDFSC